MHLIYFYHLQRDYRLNVGRIWLTVDMSCSAHVNFDTSFAYQSQQIDIVGGKDDNLQTIVNCRLLYHYDITSQIPTLRTSCNTSDLS